MGYSPKTEEEAAVVDVGEVDPVGGNSRGAVPRRHRIALLGQNQFAIAGHDRRSDWAIRPNIFSDAHELERRSGSRRGWRRDRRSIHGRSDRRGPVRSTGVELEQIAAGLFGLRRRPQPIVKTRDLGGERRAACFNLSRFVDGRRRDAAISGRRGRRKERRENAAHRAEDEHALHVHECCPES